MIEMMLAIAIGAIVVSIAMSMFAAIDRAQTRYERRFEASLGLGRIRFAASRAMEQLLVADSERPAELDDPENLEQLLLDGGASLGGGGRPRFILEPDPALPLMEYQPDPNAPAELFQPQRFEVTLRSAPVYALAAGGDSLALDDADALDDLIESMRRAAPRDRARDEDDADNAQDEDGGEEDSADDDLHVGDEEAEEAAAEDLREAPLAPGVRGVFELSADEDREPGEPISWTLWWCVIGDSFETASLDAAIDVSRRANVNRLMGDTIDEEDGSTRVKLAEGLRTVRWTARRDGESMDRLEVVWWRDLPAYVELETMTLDGRWNKWMFEVSWTQGPEPGTPESGAPAADEEGGEGDQDDGAESIPEDAKGAIDAAIGIGGDQ
jgi:hypothetical protein